jgi:hypothetical protein
MTEHQPPSPLDELVAALLECGGALSQIISHMLEFQAAGRSVPDAAPIPEVAHTVIKDATRALTKRHSKRDIRVAAKIVEQATTEICDNVFFVGPELN